MRYARQARCGRAVNGGQSRRPILLARQRLLAYFRRDDPNPLRSTSTRTEADIGALAAKLATDGYSSALARLSGACGSPLRWSSPAGLPCRRTAATISEPRCARSGRGMASAVRLRIRPAGLGAAENCRYRRLVCQLILLTSGPWPCRAILVAKSCSPSPRPCND